MNVKMERRKVAYKEMKSKQDIGGIFGGEIGHEVGVIPVRVEVPVTGIRFLFEQLLVQEKSLHITATYQRNTKGNADLAKTRGREHQKKCCCFYC